MTALLAEVLVLYEVSKGKLASNFAKVQTHSHLLHGVSVLHLPTEGPGKLFVPENMYDSEVTVTYTRLVDAKRRIVVIPARPEMFL